MQGQCKPSSGILRLKMQEIYLVGNTSVWWETQTAKCGFCLNLSRVVKAHTHQNLQNGICCRCTHCLTKCCGPHLLASWHCSMRNQTDWPNHKIQPVLGFIFLVVPVVANSSFAFCLHSYQTLQMWSAENNEWRHTLILIRLTVLENLNTSVDGQREHNDNLEKRCWLPPRKQKKKKHDLIEMFLEKQVAPAVANCALWRSVKHADKPVHHCACTIVFAMMKRMATPFTHMRRHLRANATSVVHTTIATKWELLVALLSNHMMKSPPGKTSKTKKLHCNDCMRFCQPPFVVNE